MKKFVAIVLALVAVLVLAAGVYAAGRLPKEEVNQPAPEKTEVTLEEAKQTALNRAGLTEAEVTFTQAGRDFDNGRAEYEFEFTANGMEYDVDVDIHTGEVIDFEAEPCNQK